MQLFVVEDIDIGVDGFMAISALPELRSLTLTSCDGIDRAGLELLCGLSNLQYLDMSDVWEFAGDTLQPLASLTKLQVCLKASARCTFDLRDLTSCTSAANKAMSSS